MPKRPTDQSEHVAKKVQWLLSRPSVTIELLADLCEVKKPSVYDWRDYGRVAKKHLPRLATLAGTTTDWWLTPDAPIPPTNKWLAAPPSDDHAHLGEEIQPGGTSRTIRPSLTEALNDWRLQASPRSIQTLDHLTFLARKGRLTDDDWALIDALAERFTTK